VIKAPFSNSYVSFEIKNDILYVIYLPGAFITIDIAKDIVKQRIEYTGGDPYAMLITGEGLRAINKEARDYLSADGTIGVIAGALLVNSVYTEFFGNFFLRITKPEIPAKLFTDKNKALEWLEQFKNKN
jgi:hypothetical protein